MTLKKFIVLLLLSLPIVSYGQARKVWLFHADNFYEIGDYQNALVNYHNALSDSVGLQDVTIPYEISQGKLKLKNKETQIDSNRVVPIQDYIEHQIATCYMKTFDYKRAIAQFEKTSEFSSYPEDQYYFGVAQMNMNLHKEALETFDKYIKSDNYNDSLLRSAQLLKTGCFYAMDDQHFKKKVRVSLADTVVFNKGSSSFAPMFFEGENSLMFTSAREGGIVFDPTVQESAYLCDLYWTRYENGKWENAHNFGRPLNSSQHDASGTFSRNNIIYYTRWSNEKPKEQAIYLARMVDFMFYEAFKLPESVNLEGYRSINPFVTEDGKWLYFSSDRPGGEGGLDVWRIELDEAGNVKGEAENLGRPVNSELDEKSPYLHETSMTLFFSSNGHNSIGGQDIFKSRYFEDDKRFDKPQNMGMPINSSMDDSYIIWDKLMQKGFFASDREPCEFGHCYNIYEVTNEPIKIELEGYAYDIQTDEILPNATLFFKDIDYVFEPFTIQTDDEGYYHKDLDQNQEIFIKATMPKYFADAASVTTKPITESKIIQQDFYLDRIPEEEIELDGIEYDFDKATLRQQSEAVLDELYRFLVFNSNLIVEINSHTDARGSDTYNQDLSERRAKSCVDYLIKKGISANRLKAVGYGESQPNHLKNAKNKPVLGSDGKRIFFTEEYINSQASEEKQEELHQRNRRTSFKVVGEGFELESN